MTPIVVRLSRTRCDGTVTISVPLQYHRVQMNCDGTRATESEIELYDGG